MFILDLKSVTKDKNTIILPNVDYNKDIEDIKKGLYNNDKEEFVVNGRSYISDSGHFYPGKGEGFVTLNKIEYEVFKFLKSTSAILSQGITKNEHSLL